MSEMGYAMMGSGVASGEDRAEEAAGKLFLLRCWKISTCPARAACWSALLPGFDLREWMSSETVGNTIRAFASDQRHRGYRYFSGPGYERRTARDRCCRWNCGMDKRPEMLWSPINGLQQPVLDRYQQHGMAPLTQGKTVAKVVNDNTPQAAKEPDYLDIPAFLRNS